jgi:hypothetical protein
LSSLHSVFSVTAFSQVTVQTNNAANQINSKQIDLHLLLSDTKYAQKCTQPFCHLDEQTNNSGGTLTIGLKKIDIYSKDQKLFD